MNTKRIVRWVIVLLLLAALPGLTAVLAQEQGPPAKAPLPAVTEPSESVTPVYTNLTESEPNNTFGTADVMAYGDAMAATISAPGDVDYFKFRILDVGGPTRPYSADETLINLDAQSIGSPLDTVVTLYDSAGTVIGSNDDTDTLDSLYYYKLLPGWYYLKVEDFGNNNGGASYVYNLMVAKILLISAAAANLGTATIDGIPFQSGDILAAYAAGANPTWNRWVMFFDISDLGINKNVDKLATMGNSADILIGFQVNVTLPGTSIVAKPQDIVRFQPGKYGGTTEGTMYRYMIGANNDLTTTAEKLDAIGDWMAGAPGGARCDGYPVSTTGAATVRKVGGGTFKAADEDIFCKEALSGFGLWKPYFDNSLVSGLGVEDVVAFDYNEYLEAGYFVIQGTGNIAGHPVNQKQIFSLWPPQPSWRNLSWDGPAYGWIWNIDAIDVSFR
jgi:hypothetical protein